MAKNNKKTQIGLLGGSFDPPHKGHIHISKEVEKALKLNQIWWLITKQNPLKKRKAESFKKRVEKCYKITSNYSFIKIKEYEKELSTTYLYDLLLYVIKKNPDFDFNLILGSDNLENIHLWHKWQELTKLVTIIIVNRPKFNFTEKGNKIFDFYKNLYKTNSGKDCIFLKIKPCDISSRKIRENAK